MENINPPVQILQKAVMDYTKDHGDSTIFTLVIEKRSHLNQYRAYNAKDAPSSLHNMMDDR